MPRRIGEGTQLDVIIPADVHQQLKACAVAESASMPELVTEALKAILAEKQRIQTH